MRNKNVCIFSRKKSRRWLLFPITAVVLLLIFAAFLYVYINVRIRHGAGGVIGKTEASASSAISEADEITLQNIDVGNDSGAKQKDIPIIGMPPIRAGTENILLIGTGGAVTGNNKDNSASDKSASSLITASLDTKNKSLRLVLLSKDTKAFYSCVNGWHRLNSAFALGGAGLQVNVINTDYGLDIQKYIIVNLNGFQNVVNALGGVPMELSANDARSLQLGENAGTYSLNGEEALAYLKDSAASGESKASRQAELMINAVRKTKNVGAVKSLEAANQCLGCIKTNIPPAELIAKLYAMAAAEGNIKELSLPSANDGNYSVQTAADSALYKFSREAELKSLRTFLYGSG